MNHLLDTVVVSQTTKGGPHGRSLDWLEKTLPSAMYLSVISILEIRLGVDRLPSGKKRDTLSRWLEQEVPAMFENRILLISAEVANDAGSLIAACINRGFNVEPMDALIAATARVHGMSVATLNVKHFKLFDVPLVDLS